MVPPSLLCFLLPLLCPEPDPLALYRRWRDSQSPELRIQAVRSLRGHAGRESRAALLSLLDDEHPAVRAVVRAELVARPPDEGPELAREILALSSARARVEGVRALLARKEDVSAFALDREGEAAARALALGRVAEPQAREALRHRDARVRALALEALKDRDLARARADDPAEEVRIAAVRVARDAATLLAALRDRSWRVRLAAVLAAETLRDAACIPGLLAQIEGPPGRLRARAAKALETLTGVPIGEDAEAWKLWSARQEPNYRFPEAPPTPPPAAPAPGETRTVASVRYHSIPVASRRVCFVLDASRSMLEPAPGTKGRTRWDLAREDLTRVLERLPPDARFNVILFRTDVEAWKPRLVQASSSYVAACRAWIEEAKPRGWTNLFDALALAIADDDVDALFVLTDGVPSRGTETARAAILEEIGFLNRFRMVQINCVQAGSSEGLGKRWEGFLDDLAAAHDGVAVRE
jgi:hypothetical protein